MNGETTMTNTQTEAQTVAGNEVIQARSHLEGLEDDLKSSENRINSYRVKKQGYNTELEILRSKHDGDTSKLPYDLQLKVLDLTKDVAELDSMISYGSNRESEKHAIEMANINLASKQGVYQDLVRKENTTLTSADIEELKHKTMVSMPMSEKMQWIDKLGGGEVGMKKLQEYCPII